MCLPRSSSSSSSRPLHACLTNARAGKCTWVRRRSAARFLTRSGEKNVLSASAIVQGHLRFSRGKQFCPPGVSLFQREYFKEKMIFFDSMVLNMIERACRRFQRLTGRTNVWLALQLTNLSIVVYFVWAGVVFAAVEAWLRIAVAIFCAALLYVLVQTLFRESIEAYERSAYQRVANRL